MSTMSNQLNVPKFWITNAPMNITVHKALKTPLPRAIETLTTFPLLATSVIQNWRLKATLMVQLRHKHKMWSATTWLEGVAEYGTGKTADEALVDLIVSLGDYLESLKKRKARLGASALEELKHLESLIERLVGE
ncbi:MAG: hypothetical protein HY666_02070 [Chloroflexi bacterium]|nr:hypothetical protein [Chloroflexota bacterium]